MASFARADLEPGPSGALGHASLDPPEPVDLECLERRFGPAHRGPRGHPGRPRVVQFNETLPLEGAVGGTVLAELDDIGRVVRVMVRRDTF